MNVQNDNKSVHNEENKAKINVLMALPNSDVGNVWRDINRSTRREQPPVRELIEDVAEGVGVLFTGVYAAEETIWRSRAKSGVPLPVAGSHPDVALKPFVPHPRQKRIS